MMRTIELSNSDAPWSEQTAYPQLCSSQGRRAPLPTWVAAVTRTRWPRRRPWGAGGISILQEQQRRGLARPWWAGAGFARLWTGQFLSLLADWSCRSCWSLPSPAPSSTAGIAPAP